jgi:hypothetical protein
MLSRDRRVMSEQDEAYRQFEEWVNSLPKYCGFCKNASSTDWAIPAACSFGGEGDESGSCDGNLVGLEHKDNCPRKGLPDVSYFDVWQASAHEERKRIADLAATAKSKRTTWLESYGVPISQEFADFAEAIGLLIEVGLADRIERERLTTPATAKWRGCITYCKRL